MSAEPGDDREEGEVGGRSATENVVTILVQGHSNEILLICGGFAMFPRQIHERCRGKAYFHFVLVAVETGPWK